MIPSKAELQAELAALASTIKNKAKRYRVLKDTKKALKRKYGIEL